MTLIKHIAPKLFLFIVFGLLTQISFAQTGATIKGQVLDTVEKVRLFNASVNLLRAKDSVLLHAIRTDKDGRFQLADIPNGKYIVMISYPHYADYIDQIQVQKDMDLNALFLNTKTHLLKEVIVRNSVAAIRIKGDTTEFKADSFRVTPNSDVQELLKHMPGIQVNARGEITAQGEKVNKVLVDGEEFFSDDPAVVTKNLRADAVDKVQLFDKKSDQATFTGIDDGIKSKTINLQLKEDKKNGYFGKGELGSNFGEYGYGKLMANSFKGKKKLAGYYSNDNTKFEALSWDEVQNYSDGGNTNTQVNEDGGISINISGDDYDETKGLPNQQRAGLVFSNKWDKVSTNNTAQYQNLLTNALGTNFTKTLLQDSSIINNTSSIQHIDKKKYSFKTINEWGTDSTGLFKMTVKVADILKNAGNDYTGQTSGESGHKINQSARITSLNEDDKSVNSSLSYRRKFAKKGRTISWTADLNFNDKAQDGALNARNDYFNFAGSTIKKDSTNQLKNSSQNTSSINTNLIYTEPLSTKDFLIFKYGVVVGKNNAARYSYDLYKPKKDYTAAYDPAQLVDSLSNHFIFNTLNQSGSVNYRHIEKKYNFVFGSGFGTAHYTTNDLQKNTQRAVVFNNFIPSFSFNLTPKPQRRINFDYSGSTVNPTLQQIQPLIDNSDPLNITIGNANLQQGFTNRFSFNASDYKVLKSRFIGINASYSSTQNDISSSNKIDAFGKNVSQFVNVDGNYNFNVHVNFQMELFKGINGGLGIGNSMNRYVNYVNGVKNINDNSAIRYTVSISHWGEGMFSFYSGFNANNNHIVSSIRSGAASNYWSYSAYGNGEIKFKKIKTYIDFNLDANLYQKSSVFPDQRNVYIFSPSIRKVFSKTDAWELKLFAFDLLNQNTNVNRNISSNFISENTNNGLKRYFLLSIVYNFSKNGKPSNMMSW
jgi:hypothetical protein